MLPAMTTFIRKIWNSLRTLLLHGKNEYVTESSGTGISFRCDHVGSERRRRRPNCNLQQPAVRAGDFDAGWSRPSVRLWIFSQPDAGRVSTSRWGLHRNPFRRLADHQFPVFSDAADPADLCW